MQRRWRGGPTFMTPRPPWEQLVVDDQYMMAIADHHRRLEQIECAREARLRATQFAVRLCEDVLSLSEAAYVYQQEGLTADDRAAREALEAACEYCLALAGVLCRGPTPGQPQLLPEAGRPLTEAAAAPGSRPFTAVPRHHRP